MNVVEQLGLPNLEASLARVERELSAAVGSDDRFLSEVAGHLIAAGGKRLRPALVLAAAAACGAEATDEVVAGAVSVELVHLGSLYHDDVIDAAGERRGVSSVNARWGNLVAILVGDFLLAKASEIAASLGTEVAALLARTIGQLCRGEVSQMEFAFDPGRPEEAYLRAIEGKTAALMATSSRIGALVSGAGTEATEALTEFGRCFGMAFQIWDDIRDLVASEEVLGKPAGHDMVEGTYTLPVIKALALPELGPELRALLDGTIDGPTRDKARDLVVASAAVEASIADASGWAARASEALSPLRDAGGAGVESLGRLGSRLLETLDSP
ncbi:MAG: polyprenyl synthetase family protein [Acidimicrobiales bacterium]